MDYLLNRQPLEQLFFVKNPTKNRNATNYVDNTLLKRKK